MTDVPAWLEQHEPVNELDLLAIPAKRLQPASIELRATLREALEVIRRHDAEALYVVQTRAGRRRIHGVITRATS